MSDATETIAASTASGRIVIVGAGQAAARAADTLRRRGFAGSIALVGDEPCWPYQRPPLSKKYLAGALDRDRIVIRQAQFYTDRAIEAYLGRRAEELDRRTQRIRLDDGSTLAYDTLLLATGSRPRTISLPGAELDGIHVLRTVADADRFRDALTQRRRLVVVGGGYIGLEVAATCREVGLEVTVLEMAERVMSRVVCAEVSTFYEAEHAQRGVRIVCNARISAFTERTAGRVGAVWCADGSEHPADIVMIGVGASPAVELAVQAGIECSNGILVDAHCRTSDPRIYAAGDCTNHPNLRYARRVRLESVDNAVEQGATAALNMLGIATQHNTVPWFWSDQFDLKLIIVGLTLGYDRLVLRGDPRGRSFSACYLRDGELIAIDTINSAGDQIAARKLIAARARPDLSKLANAEIPLRDC